MEMGVLGEVITREATDSTAYYGFWMPRGGDEGTFAIDAIVLPSANKFQVFIQTKDSDTADSSASTLGSAQTISTPGITKWTVTGAKDWVRYVVQPTGTGASWMHFQLVAPQWTPN